MTENMTDIKVEVRPVINFGLRAMIVTRTAFFFSLGGILAGIPCLVLAYALENNPIYNAAWLAFCLGIFLPSSILFAKLPKMHPFVLMAMHELMKEPET